MYFASRQFIIPQTEEEKSLLQKDKTLEMRTISFRRRECTFFQSKIDDVGLLSEFLDKLNNKYKFSSLCVADIKSSEDAYNAIIKAKPEILIDVRKDSGKLLDYNLIRTRIDQNNIHYRWMPKFGQKEERKFALYEIREILTKYRRIMLIGTKESLLEKLVNILKDETKVEVVE